MLIHALRYLGRQVDRLGFSPRLRCFGFRILQTPPIFNQCRRNRDWYSANDPFKLLYSLLGIQIV